MWKFLAKVPDRADWIVPILVAVLSGLATVWWANHTGTLLAQTALATRISAVEAHQAAEDQKQADQQDHIAHIEAQVDKLVEWALGHK